MKKISEEILFNGQWLVLKQTVLENHAGEEFVWESIVRQNESSSLVIIPKLIPSNRYVLIKQFRPAINGYIIGFPAGLDNDSDRDIIQELKEETGYTGTIIHRSIALKSQSGIMNDSGRVVLMHIDENDPVNHKPQQELETSEDIEVIVLAPERIEAFLTQSAAEGMAIGANLWYLFVASAWLNT